MDLANTLGNIAAQGAMFWVATGSVALGGTLILVAIIAQLRRLRAYSPRIDGQRDITLPDTLEKPSADGNFPPESDKREILLPQPEPVAEMADIRELRVLGTRLRTAADKLENFRRQSRQEPALPPESPLKEAVSVVDYVFRAGLG